MAETDTTAFHWTRREYVTVHAGDVITTNGSVGFYRMSPYSNEHHLVIFFGEQIDGYATLAKYFRPANAEDAFGEDIFIDYPMDILSDAGYNMISITIGDVDEMWVPYYYRDILAGQSRKKLLEIFPDLTVFDGFEDGRHILWHEHDLLNIQFGRAMFYNSAIRLGTGATLAIRNITKTDSGYMVDCVISTLGMRAEFFPNVSIFPESKFWKTYVPGDTVTLLLHLDGDYLDIHTNSDIHVGTFIRVGREFIAQYQSLIRTNTADLTNVQWPSRADGSTGVRPRPEPDPMQLAVEDYAEEPAEIPATDTASDIPGQETLVAQGSTNATPPMPWALLAVIAGAVVIVGGAVLVVAKRKRAQG